MRRHDVVAALLIGGGLCPPAFAGNWIQNGDFESDQPPQWSSATVERELMGRTDRVCPLLGVGHIHQANPSHAAAAAVIGRHLQTAREEGMRAAGFFAFYDIRPHTETSRAHSTTLSR